MLFLCQQTFAQDTLDSIVKVKSMVYFDDIELLMLLSGVDSSNPGNDALNKMGKPISYSSKLVELAETGNAVAQNFLGHCYLEGEGIEQNSKKAVFWFSKAAEKNNSKAYNNLGYCYENGVGVEQSPFQAYSFYKKSALLGHNRAFNNLAQCYLHGTGTPVDSIKARAWFEKGAEAGIRTSQTNVGYLYLSIEGEEDYDKAFYWLTKASEQNSQNALEMLGMCYENGWGTKVDLSKAQECYRKSYQLGNEYAKIRIK